MWSIVFSDTRMYAHNSLIYFLTLTVRQHSCLREETNTNVISYYNNVPNNTSVFEHWSGLTVYWQFCLRRLERGTFEFGYKWFQPSFQSCSVHFFVHTYKAIPYTFESQKNFFFTISHQAWELFILFYNLILVIRTFRVSSFLTNRTAVERHDILKSDRTFSSSKLSPCRTIKHKNLVPLI